MKPLLFISLFCLLLLPSQVSSIVIIQEKPTIQLATKYKAVDDINQYWISEKLDGMRGYWDGKQLLTRQGNLIHSPKWFTQHWPVTAMEGELWLGRNQFQQTISCVKKINIDENCWKKVRFMIFDLPRHSGTFTQRVKTMEVLTKKINSSYLTPIKQFKVKNLNELEQKLNNVIAHQGEGLMLHRGSAYYHIGRTVNILKLKKHQDAEATVIAHIAGKGKYSEKLGAIKVKTPDGTIFKIGSGFNDYERAHPPKIGATITYKYNGKTQAGVPRFARFWRVKCNKACY